MVRSRDMARGICQDRVHGAAWLAREALRCLSLVAEESLSSDDASLLNEIREQARELASARPSMAPISNYVSLLVQEVGDNCLSDVVSLRTCIVDKAKALVDESDKATQSVVDRAAELMVDHHQIMTVSYSSTVVRALDAALTLDNNSPKRILAVESRSSAGISYGEMVAESLAAWKGCVEVVPDDRIELAAEMADLVVVGADSILPDGSLINGTPTRRVAEATTRHSIAFHVLAETTKINASSLLGRPVEIESGFDLISAHLVTAYHTELGKFTAERIEALASQWAKYLRAL